MASDSPSYLVVEEVARREGVPPTKLSPPLQTVVDSDALDALVRPGVDSTRRPIEVEFRYMDYLVRIRDGPTVSIAVEDAVAPTDVADSTAEQRAESED